MSWVCRLQTDTTETFSKQNGSVGGYMVKKMIEAQERSMSPGQSGQVVGVLIQKTPD